MQKRKEAPSAIPVFLVAQTAVMPERGIDTVTIPLSRETITLPWASQQELLAQFKHLESMRPVHDAFTAVGTSAPVRLTQAQKADLLTMIEQWAMRTGGGYTTMPDGIFDLRNALHDELHDNPST